MNILYIGGENLKTSKGKFQIGDIFSLKLNNGEFAFGRCISEISLGHIVEIFNYFSEENKFNTTFTEQRLFEPIPIDTWGLFGRRKKEGNWQVIGHEENFIPKNVEHLRYWGMAGEKVTDTKLMNIFDKDCGDIEISKVNSIENRELQFGHHFKVKGMEQEIFLLRSPWGDFDVQKEIELFRNRL